MSVYGDLGKKPVSENYNCQPKSCYGASKLAGESLIQAYCESYGFKCWIYRFVSKGWDPTGSDPYINTDSDGYNMVGHFPQAGRNYLLGLTLGF